MNILFRNYLILNDHHRDATAGDVKELFGLKQNQAWPAEGMKIQVIQGTICWVYPLRKGEGFRLRAYCSCRFCGKAVPIGRLRQHVEGHSNNEVNIMRVETEHGNA
jgi:hypothetical protein